MVVLFKKLLLVADIDMEIRIVFIKVTNRYVFEFFDPLL